MNEKTTLRITRQRRVILDELRKVKSHPTADKVYEMVRKRMPNISLGTVYRNLEIMSEQGAIRKLEFGGSQKRFDGNTEPHHHVRCEHCGSVGDVFISFVLPINEDIQGASDYEITGHQIEFSGICPGCSEQDQ